MDVSDCKFDDVEISRLEQYRDRQQDARLKVRFMALLMLAKGIAIKDIGVIRTTIKVGAYPICPLWERVMASRRTG